MEMDFLKQRAKSFHRNALHLIDEGEFALASFNIEQATQFELKYFLAVKAGDFPRNHSIKTLLKECIRFCPQIEGFYQTRLNIIGEIERVHFMSRCYPLEYDELEVKGMEQVYSELNEVFKKCP